MQKLAIHTEFMDKKPSSVYQKALCGFQFLCL